MCGICCILFCTNKDNFKTLDDLQKLSFINSRGPDLHGNRIIEINSNTHLYLAGFVLHLRGQPTQQPLVNDNGDCFLWNGELFGGLQVTPEENDTQVIFSKLVQCKTNDEMLHIFEMVEGPWAFIYWENNEKRLWFGRDKFGRRSLLWHLPKDPSDIFSLSSVRIQPHEFHEVPSVGIVCMDMKKLQQVGDENLHLTLYPWKFAVWPGTADRVDNQELLKSHIYPEQLSNVQFAIDKDTEVLSWIPTLNKQLPPDDWVHLALNEKSHKEYLSELLLSNELLKKSSDQLLCVLESAVRKRVYNIPRCETLPNPDHSVIIENIENFPNNLSSDTLYTGCEDKMKDRRLANIAILFSGGIDSAIITALADRCIPQDESIDLVNVAFEQQPKLQPNTLKKGKQATPLVDLTDKFNVPDRQTGYAAFSELNPNRCWNFVEVNVTPEELKDVRSNRVRHLVYPACTVLDDSIGCALWFAARGYGIVTNGPEKGKPFCSKAKVILCGMGADEQLAGYSRHRSRYSEGQWKGLLDEIEMEIQRISGRNLGRDDRIIGDHGKEARFPFLDEQVVSFLSSLPIHIKAQLDLPRGLGEKLLLRLCAYQLGLHSTSCFPKRAIQFGSRIAKMENSKEKAGEKCQRLTE